MRASLRLVGELLPLRLTASHRWILPRRTSRPANRQLWSEAAASATTRDDIAQRVAQLSSPRDGESSRHDASAATTLARPAYATPLSALPLVCPGCGAPTQIVDASSPGFYGRKQTQKPANIIQKLDNEDAIFAAAIGRGAIKESRLPQWHEPADETPICDRCHYLVHENTGNSIIHPAIDSIRAMIEESPHKHNHIYHILDAVDFPMSLIPNLQGALHLPRLRTQNRRSKRFTYIRGRVAEVSFIITRADLLAPKKEQVDALLPYMREILRDALGRSGKSIRLGNVRLVSAKRGWWTPVLKEEIYRRGGAGWMVGKVNVGKSSLIEVVYPKNRGKTVDPVKVRAETTRKAIDASASAMERLTTRSRAESGDPSGAQREVPDALESWQQSELTYEPEHGEQSFHDEHGTDGDFKFDESDLALLPPAPKEIAFPTMPIISALPGTTASPIRLPFGNGRGELIDLPGIERTTLADYVSPDHHKHLIIQHRIVPEQQVVRPGQSLLLGGLIRITPKTENLVFLMYPFVPQTLNAHTTSTDKAVAIQTGRYADNGEPYAGNIQSRATEAAKEKIKSAGNFTLEWDVTKHRTGPLSTRVAGKMKPENLPFMVYATDLLIEGVGWVEIVAQVRRPKQDGWGMPSAEMPEVEVFSPKGAFISNRKPMNGWLLGKPPDNSGRKRPRQTVSYKRRMEGGRAGSAKRSAVAD